MYPKNSKDAFTVIQAPQGYFILIYDRVPGVGEYVSRDPIIAFRIHHDSDAAPTPITVFNGAWEGGETYIVGPDNAVDAPGFSRWESYPAWLDEMREKNSAARPWGEVYPDEATTDDI